MKNNNKLKHYKRARNGLAVLAVALGVSSVGGLIGVTQYSNQVSEHLKEVDNFVDSYKAPALKEKDAILNSAFKAGLITFEEYMATIKEYNYKSNNYWLKQIQKDEEVAASFKESCRNAKRMLNTSIGMVSGTACLSLASAYGFIKAIQTREELAVNKDEQEENEPNKE